MEPDIGHNSGSRTRCLYRAHGDRGYTKLRNVFLQDRRLSFEARGLICFLLSLPDDWEVTVQSIIASGPSGRDKVYRMLKEAEQFGYILPEQGRKQAGKFDRQLYLVSDDPTALIERAALEIHEMEATKEPLPEKPEPAEQPVTPLPVTANPEAVRSLENQGVSRLPDLPLTAEPFTAEPLTANPEACKKNIEVNINNNPPIVPPPAEPMQRPKRTKAAIPDEYPSDFEEFWKVYPRREGKAKAYEAWKKLSLAQKRRAYLALKGQLALLETKRRDGRGDFCPHPATWINQGRFDDDPEMTNATSGKTETFWEQQDRMRRNLMAARAKRQEMQNG